MYEGNNTTSSKLTMLQLKEHEQQQDNCSLIHMFWYHMLQLYFLRMRFFQAPRDLLGQRKCTFVGWVGGGKRGRRVVLAKRGCGGGGGGAGDAPPPPPPVRRPSVRIGSEFFSIKVLYFILFSSSSFLFFLSFSLLCIIVFFFLGAIYFYNDSACCISEV